MNTVAAIAFAIAIPSIIIGGILYAFVICRALGGVSYWDSIDTFKVLKDYRDTFKDNQNALAIHKITFVAILITYASVAVLLITSIIETR